MALKTFKAIIKLKSGHQAITIVADNEYRAKDLLEAIYGRGRIFSGPTEVWSASSVRP